MALRLTSRGFARGVAAAAGIGLSLWLQVPSQAQFFDLGRPLRELFGAPRDRGWDDRGGLFDFSHAPSPAAKKPEATTSIVVMGDANADWLAYGLEVKRIILPQLEGRSSRLLAISVRDRTRPAFLTLRYWVACSYVDV